MADLVVPPLGESITEAVIAKWLKNVGDSVVPDEPVVDLETDKITVQLPSPAAGSLATQRFPVGATVRVGDIVGNVRVGAVAAQTDVPRAPSAPPKAPANAPPQVSEPPSSLSKDDLLRLPPSRRAVARERGVAPAMVAPATVVAPTGSDVGALAAPSEEVVPMSPLRKRIAERLVQAQREAAALTTFNEVDMTRIIDLRTRYKDGFEKAHGGTKLGFLSFFVRAAVAACKLFPGVNAEVRGDAIVYKKHYNFGIAVSTAKGLVVPVLRNCDQLSFAQIERGISALAEKARTGSLGLDDLAGGTFSITNGGIYGSMMSTPLLNFPQTGILGMHNIVKRPVAIGDDVAIRPVMYLALTYDHRVVDGREAVSFLVAVKERIEAPDRLMLDV